MRATLAVCLAALMLTAVTGCSGLSQPEKIRIQKEVVMLNPPPQVPIAAPQAPARPGGPGAAPRRGG
ncbi:MAG: hypothetical protein JRI23_02500 [Deltaproteobacteria bacterium]|jgi:hypothetical protein|nr:hypothetical protein [Deltaproteobacteria bacterium]MBW2530365.1 hypothetical protein [Deltaproteobacteria bacterium]